MHRFNILRFNNIIFKKNLLEFFKAKKYCKDITLITTYFLILLSLLRMNKQHLMK